MGERFLAFLCDISVEWVLLGSLLMVCYWKSSLHLQLLAATTLTIISIAYMTLWESLFHRTMGKWLLRIQVRADSPELPYPSPFRILIRESLGKLLCASIFGIGFLAGTWNPKKKTWADRIANTVVVRMGITSGAYKAVLAVILVGANVALSITVTDLPLRLKQHVVNELLDTESRIDDLHFHIFNSFFTPEPRSAEEYQLALATLPSTLDEYDRLLAAEQELVRKSRNLINAADSFENDRLEVYDTVIRWRQEIASLVRAHVQLVIGFDPQRQTWKELLQDRREMMLSINSRNNQINTIGGSYIPHRITFD